MNKIIFFSIFSISLTFATDFSCLKGEGTFSFCKDSSGAYSSNDKNCLIYLSEKEKGKHLLLEAKSDSYLSINGISILFSKNSPLEYKSIGAIDEKHNYIVPLCDSNEIYLYGEGENWGTTFGKI